jgi:hypothetical protein
MSVMNSRRLMNSFRDALPDRYRETGSSSYSLPS